MYNIPKRIWKQNPWPWRFFQIRHSSAWDFCRIRTQQSPSRERNPSFHMIRDTLRCLEVNGPFPQPPSLNLELILLSRVKSPSPIAPWSSQLLPFRALLYVSLRFCTISLQSVTVVYITSVNTVRLSVPVHKWVNGCYSGSNCTATIAFQACSFLPYKYMDGCFLACTHAVFSKFNILNKKPDSSMLRYRYETLRSTKTRTYLDEASKVTNIFCKCSLLQTRRAKYYILIQSWSVMYFECDCFCCCDLKNLSRIQNSALFSTHP